jgi:hypothetical protein
MQTKLSIQIRFIPLKNNHRFVMIRGWTYPRNM